MGWLIERLESCCGTSVDYCCGRNWLRRRIVRFSRAISYFGVNLREFGDAEVEHFDSIATEPVRFEPDVFGFQIAMDNSLLVGFMHRRANLLQDIHYPLQRQPLFLYQTSPSVQPSRYSITR